MIRIRPSRCRPKFCPHDSGVVSACCIQLVTLFASACQSPDDPSKNQTSYTVGGATTGRATISGSGMSGNGTVIDSNPSPVDENRGGARGSSSGIGKGGIGSGGAPSSTTRKKLTPDNVMRCDAITPVVMSRHIEAECAFANSSLCNGTTGGQLGTQLEREGKTVGYVEGGDHLYYDDLRMDGLRRLKVHYAKGVDGGKVEVRLGGPAGEVIGTWIPISTGSWETWSDATIDLDPHSGIHSLYLVFTGSTAGIVNLDWFELTAQDATNESQPIFHLNQIGFDSLGPKHAVIEGGADLTRYYLVNAGGETVWCGDLVAQSFTAWDSSNSFYSVDFSELTRSGTYRLQVGATASAEFTIDDDRLFYQGIAPLLNYFRSSRADDADVWAADESVPFNGTDQRADVRGGWYDAAGDISKYLSHLSYANYLNPQQIPLVDWALAWVYDNAGSALSALESGPQVQAEALWGADYLLRVLDPAGFFYMTVFDNWSGNLGQRQICAFEGQYGATNGSWQTALREGGGMSIAALARIARWKTDGEFTSAEYLAGAELAFGHLDSAGVTYADDGVENIIDDYTGLLAATELYDATKMASYLDAARKRATSLVARLSEQGYFIADGAERPFWHASDAGLPVVALVRYLDLEIDGSRRTSTINAIRRHLNYQLTVTDSVTNPFGYARQHVSPTTAGFFIPHDNESGYWWQGENARLASLAAAALLGADALQASDREYLDLLRFAGTQLDWILGANPYDLCFLHGFGTKNPPAFCASKPQHGTLKGGIANGITGRTADGGGIQWLGDGCSDEWRWTEQWLPHAAWYLVAITALARQ